ncbi:uncharacterized protein LOC142591302 [Dermacentor variabilis]|uniref:uncharacterized protein LOC142591302 n=1 Tax=Dermacentor variabilis TaxID=34621 RepID=UPI003F5B252F
MFRIVVYIAVLSVACGAYAVTFDNLLTALNTTERIWTHTRSLRAHHSACVHKCQHYVKLSLDRMQYKFLEYYKCSGKMQKRHLYGQLIPHMKGQLGPVMRVSMCPGAPAVDYTLRYWDHYERCAIYTTLLRMFPARNEMPDKFVAGLLDCRRSDRNAVALCRCGHCLTGVSLLLLSVPDVRA